MSDIVHILEGQVVVMCPNVKCKQFAATSSKSTYRCGYCGTKFQVKKCIFKGRNYKE